MSGIATAVAHPNIALAKYWGKLDVARNVPSVPSLSMTLDAMSTTTSVGFEPGLEDDRVVINGSPASDEQARRVTTMLDRVRAVAGIRTRASVETANDFPTSSGLASSASGFAALAVAAARAAGLAPSLAELSDLARRSSASAARSLFGGFAVLPAGAAGQDFLAAEPLSDAADWDIAISVVMTTLKAKEIGSTSGMGHTAKTSPYYAAWIAHAPRLYDRARAAVIGRDLEALGTTAEESAFAMHACALAAAPPLVYFSGVTMAAIERVRALRKSGVPAYVTVDAGPHVKVLSTATDATRIAEALREVPGVERVVVAKPGPAASIKTPRGT